MPVDTEQLIMAKISDQLYEILGLKIMWECSGSGSRVEREILLKCGKRRC